MDVRDYKEFDNHEFFMVLTDKHSGLKAYIAVHNTNLGPALGGTRMISYPSDREAIADVLNLSKAMSFKCALADLPYGGGKAVIQDYDSSLSRNALLTSYAKCVDRLRGLFKTGTDVGITDDDVKHMYNSTTHMLGALPADRGELTTGKAAALGVFYSIKATLEKIYGNDNVDGRTFAVKGIGKLGGELVRLLSGEGARVYISDVEQKKSSDMARTYKNVKSVKNEEIDKLDVDIYSPCALGNEFTKGNINRLNCKAIVGGANNQLGDESVGDELHKLGIIYTPDYVVNAGGLIYVADELEPGGFSRERVELRTMNLRNTVKDILDRSESENLPPGKIADSIARERLSI